MSNAVSGRGLREVFVSVGQEWLTCYVLSEVVMLWITVVDVVVEKRARARSSIP